MRYIIGWQFIQELLCLSVHDLLSGFSTASAGLFGLDVEDSFQTSAGCVRLVRDVSIRVQPKHLWRVHVRHLLNQVSVLLNRLAFRDSVSLKDLHLTHTVQ